MAAAGIKSCFPHDVVGTARGRFSLVAIQPRRARPSPAPVRGSSSRTEKAARAPEAAKCPPRSWSSGRRHMSHKGARGRGSPRGRQGAAGQSRVLPDAATPAPPNRFPAAAARRPAAPRPERGEDAGAPPLLCVPPATPRSPPPRARPRGAEAPRLRCPSHAARGLSREQSAAARSRRHVPPPSPRAQPAPQEHGGAAAAPAEPARPSAAAALPGPRASEGGSEPSPRPARACSRGRGQGSGESRPGAAHAG